MKNRKLILKKEKIGSLSNMNEIRGGKAAELIDAGGSTEHNFTCGWCTQVSKGGSCFMVDGVCVDR